MQTNSFNIIKVYKKKLYILASLIILFFLSFSFLDTTKVAKKVDLIVSLGGDKNLDRINKAILLYKNNFSATNKILLTGYNEEIKYKDLDNLPRLTHLLKNGIERKNIFLAYNTKNTRMEMIYLIDFMLFNNFNSAIIVTDPPHSRRVKLLLNFFDSEKEFTFIIVSSEAKWWETKLNSTSIKFVFSEYLKIIHNFLKIFFHQP